MGCPNCNPDKLEPGHIIKAIDDFQNCAECGAPLEVRHKVTPSGWNEYFHKICVAVASKSPCLSRNIGAILVRDKSIVATGYNGPPRGVPHCGHDRIMKDEHLVNLLSNPPGRLSRKYPLPSVMQTTCPRKLLGYESGTHMELCPAQHAEANCITNAARLGVVTLGTTLYMNCVIPCEPCFGKLINAGIVEIVVDDITVYDRHTDFLMSNSDIIIRSFKCES